jgi:hypothetical protein
LKNRRLLTLIQECQEHDPAVRKFQRIVMSDDPLFVDLPKDCGFVGDHLRPPAQEANR